MGISRDRRHKHRATGGRMPIHQKKRKYELGRSPANTKLGATRVRPVRCRGGNLKHRALRLETGSYSWGSENISRKTRILQVVYNATNNELVRTNTLVKNTVVVVDASPFKQWYASYYGIDLGKKRKAERAAGGATSEAAGGSASVAAGTTPVQAAADLESGASGVLAHKQRKRAAKLQLDPGLEEQIASGRVLACISSRPGQCGRADGYLLEGIELQFYKRKLEKKKSKQSK